MGSTDEQFCLRWNDFQQCIKSTFQDLRDENDFMDVTISCDGEQVKAHKVILSACSVTFKTLLKKNPAQHPVIVLWDVSPRDLAAILDFMYHGEVNVKQDHLNSFLAVAERLRVRGLCQNENSAGPSGSSTTKFTNNAEKPKLQARQSDSSFSEPSSKKPRIGSFSQSHDDDIEELPAPVAVKQELSDPTPPIAPPPIRRAPTTPIVHAPQPVVQQFAPPPPPQEDYQIAESGQYDESMQGSEYGDYSGYEDEMGYGAEGGMMDQSQGKGLSQLSCYVCGKKFSRSDGLKTHIRDIHENAGKTFHCELCNKPSKSLNALKVHMSTYHRSDKSASNTMPIHFLGSLANISD